MFWKVLIAQGCFSYGWAELTLAGPFLLLIPSSSKGLGAQGFGREHSWDSRPQVTQGCPISDRVMEPGFLGMAAHLPGHGKWAMNSMLCFALCAVIFPTDVSLSQPMCFLPVTFLVLSSAPLGSSRSVKLNFWLGLNHDTMKKWSFLETQREHFHLQKGQDQYLITSGGAGRAAQGHRAKGHWPVKERANSALI